MTPGQQRSWAFTFPADWHVEAWRGQQATADVTVHELFEWDLPQVGRGWRVRVCVRVCFGGRGGGQR